MRKNSESQRKYWPTVIVMLRSPLFLAVSFSTAVAYFLIFKYLDAIANQPLMSTNGYLALFYTLIAISSVLMGASIYSIRRQRLKKNQCCTSGTSSTVSSVFGGAIACPCHVVLLVPLLSFIGLSTASAGSVLLALINYQYWIVTLFIIINSALMYYTLKRIASN